MAKRKWHLSLGMLQKQLNTLTPKFVEACCGTCPGADALFNLFLSSFCGDVTVSVFTCVATGAFPRYFLTLG